MQICLWQHLTKHKSLWNVKERHLKDFKGIPTKIKKKWKKFSMSIVCRVKFCHSNFFLENSLDKHFPHLFCCLLLCIQVPTRFVKKQRGHTCWRMWSLEAVEGSSLHDFVVYGCPLSLFEGSEGYLSQFFKRYQSWNKIWKPFYTKKYSKSHIIYVSVTEPWVLIQTIPLQRPFIKLEESLNSSFSSIFQAIQFLKLSFFSEIGCQNK